MPKQNFMPQKLRVWIDCRKRFKLSHKHIQMARELGLNPKGFGKLNNHKQQTWKAPLPIFIEDLYFKRFKKEQPDEIKTIEQLAKAEMEKRARKKELEALRPSDADHEPECPF